ncbi:NAD(P)-binding protein [Hortaea werneckii]|nr:NAD(P)-binding protein [Hortaea werneckii]KAI7571507.1 NAD(P)-binding protein [Hortaea werneckii]KAI7623248.1 NAD(P)-binding protein [Hortaea werneckii]KAI7629114.1 NAD(P)-binding protein [Hortaea werneckii]KAI7679469.1 NAD(P)-binding protein [Hortaea werneckii]
MDPNSEHSGSSRPHKINVAVIGTGVIGPRHAKSVVSCEDATLFCLVDPSPAAAQIAQDFNVPLFGSVREMQEAGVAPDAAIVCTPNKTHVAVSEELLEIGVHVLVEKPISTTIESGRRLVEAAEQSGRHLLVGHHRRFNPFVTATKQALLENKIGRPIAVSGLWMTFKPPEYYQAPMEWHAQAGDGGPILINLVHEVDILQYLLGPITRVHAEQTISQRGHEAEEGAAILLRFASGVVGTFVLSDATPSPHSFEQGTGENPLLPQSGRDFYRIFGSEGTLSVGDMTLWKFGDGEQKTWTSKIGSSEVAVGKEVPFDEQIEHLVRVVRDEEQPRCTGKDGLSALMVCDAVKTAIATSKPVDI